MEQINHLNIRISKAKVFVRLIVGAVLVFSIACERWIDPEYNIDPASPNDVPMSLLIPTIQLDIGFNLMGIHTAQVVNIWMQFYTGVNHDGMQKLTDYRLDQGAFDILWWNIYTKQLINAKILIEKAEKQQSPHNAAVGQILTAYSLGIATDLWGDIPYSHALKGRENVLKVPFDTQEQIYSSIDSLLDQAILNLAVTDDPIGIEGDVYYNGISHAWLNAGRAIKARHTLQLSKRRGNDAYLEALTLTDAFDGNEDNMKCPFSTTVQNPHYQDLLTSPPYVVMCTTFLNELEETNDPRIPFYFGEDAAGGISAAAPGARTSEASLPGEYLAGVNGPLYLMTFSELKFIEAEAALMTGDAERAAEAYKNAVEASLLQVTGVDSNKHWLEGHIFTETAGSITLEKIIMQKRHALFGQVQAFSDWRRTGIPELFPVPDAALPEIPQRYLYPESENFKNVGNVPYIGSMTEPVWWAEYN